jgi:hypothetical protein
MINKLLKAIKKKYSDGILNLLNKISKLHIIISLKYQKPIKFSVIQLKEHFMINMAGKN